MFIEPLEDCETQEKKTVSFTCKVNRTNVTVKWMKGNQEITFSKRVVYRVDKNKHTLTIRDCSMEDEGEYCAVAGSDKSTAELIISEAPPDFSGRLMDQTVTEFEDAEFTCELSKEKADVKWFRSGRTIREGPSHYVYSGSSFSWKGQVHKTHKRKFRVSARNSAGAVSEPSEPSDPITCKDDIEEPRVMVDAKFKDVILVKAGDVFKLEADVAGQPLPSIVWTKDGKEVENTMKLQIKTSDLTAALINKDSLRRDGGMFTLTASNLGGFAKHIFNVKVLDRPGPPRGPLAVTDLTAENCVLTWSPPSDDGGANINHYVVEKRETSRLAWTNVASELQVNQFMVTKLLKGNEYIFRVM
uniref:Uncharacterized protein n=1 Tax=Paramormyrops kingsleyae TaxID=1676925 RepID=A0A3B3QG21_9TELE